MDVEELATVLRLCKEHGVSRYQAGSVVISFGVVRDTELLTKEEREERAEQRARRDYEKRFGATGKVPVNIAARRADARRELT